MKVLALTSYPVEAAATRFRLEQFVAPLSRRGITMTIRPFMDGKLFAQLYRRKSWPRTAAGLLKSGLLRLRDLLTARTADVVLVQREAMMFGPPVMEWLITRAMKRPMVLDLDDATYVSYTSPTYGGLSATLKWFGKTDDLIKWAGIVTCGNHSIGEYVSDKGRPVRIIPTVVDTEVFRPEPRDNANSPVVLGWIGTHSTFPYLESIFPVLTELAGQFSFRLKVVGAGRDDIRIPGVPVENLKWTLEDEVKHFQSLDIGLYPIDEGLNPGWAGGKSGFKAVQYMAVGVPYVATPVGGSAEIGEAGKTHFSATTPAEWREALKKLISNPELRRSMSQAGREHVLRNYGLEEQADKLAEALREVASRS